MTTLLKGWVTGCAARVVVGSELGQLLEGARLLRLHHAIIEAGEQLGAARTSMRSPL
ncbi:hypothetical protein [Subtercola frigoramans]|uniref:Uncharacterized protein n=1 Tax=Subtercola frigoramans TaxID=120298 RepID=A0ABS2L8G6_9MICO|nr:hypothetical protein [Subtercola frigoramans]MBM7473369.1 hypothetical protein [Subtercola frigoramans]